MPVGPDGLLIKGSSMDNWRTTARVTCVMTGKLDNAVFPMDTVPLHAFRVYSL